MNSVIRSLPFAPGHRPLIAILRGVQPHEVVQMGEMLVQAGFGVIEVPLNSPDALTSIRRLAESFNGRAIVGAGTVLTADAVDAAHTAGAALVLSPDCNPNVIGRAKRLGMISTPGVATITEAFRALDAGADALKMFPAREMGPATLKAWAAVLPPQTPVVAVGGVDETNWAAFAEAGARGFGFGGNLYRPGSTSEDVRTTAECLTVAWDLWTASAKGPVPASSESA